MSDLTHDRGPVLGPPGCIHVSLTLEHGVRYDLRRWEESAGLQLRTLYQGPSLVRNPSQELVSRRLGAAPMATFPANTRVQNKLWLALRFNRLLELNPTLEGHMEIVLPERLGKRFWLGMDVSPGAKLTVEFEYTRSGAWSREMAYEISRFYLGINPQARAWSEDRSPAEAALELEAMGFMFPLPASLLFEHGGARFPYLHKNGTEKHLHIPCALSWP